MAEGTYQALFRVQPPRRLWCQFSLPRKFPFYYQSRCTSNLLVDNKGKLLNLKGHSFNYESITFFMTMLLY